ncbi:MAG: ABC transporter permease [Betaproteobacteria bacterium]|nr:ABC transporter permease [Betaproteobacteria bacterium]
MRRGHFRLPLVTLRFLPVWRRNFLVWKKLAIPSVLGNLADPMLYLFGLGYGLGSLLHKVGGGSYIVFLAGGMICYSTLNSATFETLYSGFSRMHVQRTWDAILNAPMALDDIVLGELVWSAAKSLLSGFAILLVIWVFHLDRSWPMSVLVIPAVMLIGLCFSAMGLVVTALSPSYDFFMYYFTLAVTPMVLLSGVFYPVAQLPPLFQHLAALLPLTHAVFLVRPLLMGQWPAQAVLHAGVLASYAVVSYYVAVVLFRRRLLQ